jgi:hypothetical protein
MNDTNSSNPPAGRDRGATAWLLRWLFHGSSMRRLLLGAVWAVTLMALFYAEESWRGRHAWDKYRHGLEARGEQLDFSAFIPPPIPDDQNFAATPFVQSWFTGGAAAQQAWGTNFTAAEGRIGDAKRRGDWGHRHFRDLIAWAKALAAVRSGERNPRRFESDQLSREARAEAAPAVLEGLKESEPVLAELRAASHRPYSRYPVRYDLAWGILLPHLSNVKRGAQVLVLKSCAELAAGQSEAALEDVSLILYLADSLKDEPILISYLVHAACVQIAASAVWEGLAEQAWSETQLQAIQTRFQQYDFVVDSKRPLAAERAAGVLTVELLLKRKYQFGQLFDLHMPSPAVVDSFDQLFGVAGPWTSVCAQVVPRGWYHLEQVDYCKQFHSCLLSRFDAAQRRIVTSPSDSIPGGQQPREQPDDSLNYQSAGEEKTLRDVLRDILHHRVMASVLLPGIGRLPRNCAQAQVTVDQVVLACALERCRLANKEFPEHLDALVPRFIASLPHDVLTGKPYQYRRSEDGRFILYSVGWNGKDDGGVPGKALFDEAQGDWVWEYPPKLL